MQLDCSLSTAYVSVSVSASASVSVHVFGETQSKRLQKLQNRAARIIMNMSNDVHHAFCCFTSIGLEDT